MTYLYLKQRFQLCVLTSIFISASILIAGSINQSLPKGGKALLPDLDTTFTGIPREKLSSAMQEAASNQSNILLRTAIFDPLLNGEPSFAPYPFPYEEPLEWDYFLVQFKGPISEHLKNQLANEGVYLQRYIPNHAYIASMYLKTAMELPSYHGEVRWIGLFKGGYKVDPRLLTVPFSGQILIDVSIFPGEDPFSILESMQSLKVNIDFISLQPSSSGSTMRISILGEKLQPFVEEASIIKGIESIDYWELPHVMNDNSVWVVQSYDTVNRTNYSISATIWNHGITGTGQLVGIADTGCDDDMCFFRYSNAPSSVTDSQSLSLPNTGTIDLTKKVPAYYVLPGATSYDGNTACNGNPESWHGTHTSGTLVGDNYATLSTPTTGGHDGGDGMAPNAKLIFQDAGSETSGCLDGLANDYQLIFQQAYNAGVRTHSNSWGADTAGVYTSDCREADKFIYQHEEFQLFFANGNAGPGAGTVGSPAAAKNTVSVGALTNGSADANAMASFSSRGPASDGRFKPDISTPGSSIVSAAGDSSHTSNNCSTTTMSGTSMATPTAAGANALLRQYFVDGFYPTGASTASNAMTPTAALMKASLVNGAMDIATANIPNNDEGFGRVQLDNVLFFSTPSRDARKTRVWDKRNRVGIVTGQTDTYTISVTAGQPLKVSLSWTDPEASTIAGVSLINNLNLEVESPSAQIYKGNVFTSGQSTTGGTADALNTVEEVLLNVPTAGAWTIRVIGANIPGTPTELYSNRQGYALVATFGDCTNSLLAPASLTATNNGTTGIDLLWPSVSGAAVYYIYRADGNCSSTPASFYYMGKTSSLTFTDTLAQGGYTYGYKVRAADNCGEGPLSPCSSATYTGNCTLYPTFSGLASATNNTGTAACDIDLAWSAATSNCPLGSSISYNIYRGINPYFTPNPASRIATGIAGTTYTDTSVSPYITYFYIVRAEDGTTANGGPANGGNEDPNSTMKFATPYAGTFNYGTWSDDAGDINAKLSLNGEWRVTNTQNHTTGGIYSYHNANDGVTYSPNQCSYAMTPSLVLQSGQAPQLSYWVNYNIEYQWDGVVVEISTNGGGSWAPITPSAGYPSDFSQTGTPPINSCGYAATQGCFNGPTGNGALTGWTQYTHNLTSYAGQTVLIRWRFSSDPGAEFQGFFLDDIQVTFASIYNNCAVSDGFVSLDRNPYNCADTVGITVTDNDLNSFGSTNVAIQSTTEVTPETVILTETPPASGTFIGSIGTTSAPPSPNGILSVNNGDTITVTYIDANDGKGGFNVSKTDTSITDCILPVISNVTAINITTNSATITWDTSEPCNSRVDYGTSTPPGSSSSNGSFITSHSINLSSLIQCTKYYFSVTSRDVALNSATDNNSGAYFTFTTLGKAYALGPDDVEGGTGVWTATGTAGTIWHRDTCKANSGAYAWKAGSATCPGTYGSSADVYLTSNIMNFGTGGYHIRFWEWYQTESGYDYCHVQASSNGGGVWADVIATYAGSNGGWLQRDIDLSSYTGNNCMVRFWFHSDTSVVYEGWYVDDIEVSKSEACGANLSRQSNSFTDSCSGGGAGSGDGVLDPGEDAVLQLVAYNSPNLTSQSATNVTATLSTITPGITITDSIALFPNIAAGGTGNSIAPHFAFSVGSGVVCGTVINFLITFNATEGSWNDTFSLTVGTVIPGGGTALDENFAGGIPGSWTIVDGGTGGGAAATWTTANPCSRTATAPIVSLFAIIDSDCASSATQDEQLITPLLNLSSATGVTLEFDHYFYWYSGGLIEVGDVDVKSTVTGGVWTNVKKYQGASSPNPEHVTVDITAQSAGSSDTQIRFHYYNASFEWYWMVDNVKVTYTAPAGCNSIICTPVVNKSGEASKPGSPLNAAKGAGSSVSVNYTSATCATDHIVYWGSATGTISGSLNWTNEACSLGISGNASFDPGTPSAGSFFYFVIVGNNGTYEGSYGKNSSGTERIEATALVPCNYNQDLAGACI